jgi:DNA invertase Pin-like site-specific DNA recombinase
VSKKTFDYLNTLGTVEHMKPAAAVPVAILVRVSTAKQETARQVSELRALADSKGWQVVAVCEEAGVSGRADESARHGLQTVEELARAGKIKKVLVHEVSRLARRNSIVHRFVEMLEECGVSLYWHSQAMETLLPSGKRNPAASVMLALLAEMARGETEMLRERINSGLVEARRKGVKLGRPAGSGYDASRLLEQHKDIVKALKAGQSVRNAAKITSKGPSTVQRVKAALKIA